MDLLKNVLTWARDNGFWDASSSVLTAVMALLTYLSLRAYAKAEKKRSKNEVHELVVEPLLARLNHARNKLIGLETNAASTTQGFLNEKSISSWHDIYIDNPHQVAELPAPLLKELKLFFEELELYDLLIGQQQERIYEMANQFLNTRYKEMLVNIYGSAKKFEYSELQNTRLELTLGGKRFWHNIFCGLLFDCYDVEKYVSSIKKSHSLPNSIVTCDVFFLASRHRCGDKQDYLETCKAMREKLCEIPEIEQLIALAMSLIKKVSFIQDKIRTELIFKKKILY